MDLTPGADGSRRFEALVHASPDFIAIASVDQKVQFLNRAGRLLVGLDDDFDVTQTVIADFHTPEGWQVSASTQQPALLATGQWVGEHTLRDWRGGAPIPVEVSSFLIRDDRTGAPLAMATVQRDLRDRLAGSAEVARAQSAVSASTRRLEALLLHMSDVLVVTTAEGTLQYASRSTSRVLDYPEGSQLGRNVLDLIHPDDRPRAQRALHQIGTTPGTGDPLHLRLLTGDGQVRHYEALANNLLDDPSVAGIVISARDVSERHRAELSRTSATQVLEAIASEAPVRQVLTALAHWAEQELEGTLCSILLCQESVDDEPRLRDGASPSLPAAYRTAVDGLPVSLPSSPCAVAMTQGSPVLVPDLLADPRWEPYHAVARICGVRSCWSFPIWSPAAAGRMLGSFALYQRKPGLPGPDIASFIARASHLVGITLDRQLLLTRLAHQAQHDALTGLPNRPMLLDELSSLLTGAAEGTQPGPTVIFLDLDRLKIVNDSLGHDVGDELLVHIGARLQAAVGDSDLVARFGGDEFVVVSTQATDPAAAAALAQEVLAAVARPIVLEGRPVLPAASAGVVIATAGQTATDVLRDADIAMYAAKHAGGSHFRLFDSRMRQRAFDRLVLEEEIRDGLRHGQFRTFFQPVVDLTEGDRIVGVEALLRWQHPHRGLLPPAAFIDLGEETGLIVELGDWVLGAVAEQVGVWTGMGIDPLNVSVNLAAKQLTAPGLVSSVRACMQALGRWQLSLEFTESAVMGDSAATRAVIDDLAATGVGLAIDDFGTGMSSLSYLTRLPVHSLKIDRSFVTEMADKPEAVTVAAAIIGLAAQLSLSVVAEGIETQAQRTILAELGCQYGQGYLFSRPLPADQLATVLRRGVER